MSSYFVRRFGLVLALVLLLGLAVVPTSAQCSLTANNGGNDGYTCNANDPDGLDVGSGNDTVDVTASITIGGGSDGSIYSSGGNLWLVVMAGQTLNTGDHAVLMDGDGNIVAHGFINSDSHGLWLRQSDGNITFGDGGPDPDNPTYDAASHLTADDIAMWIDGSGTATNYGEIDAGTAGILVGDLAGLFSAGSLNDALDPSELTGGTINNYGDVDGGMIGLGMVGTGTINNQGVAEGDIASIAAIGTDVVINNGSPTNTAATIEEGFMGAFGYGSGTMNNYGTTHADGIGMVFISQVSIDEDALADLMSPSDPVEFYVGIGDLINSMQFEGEWTINNDGVIEAPVGVLMLGNGTINNSESGVIDAPYLGIGAYGNVDINNAGFIKGSMVGVALVGQVSLDTDFLEELLTNPAFGDSITAFQPMEFLLYAAAALNTIEFSGGGTITNSGSIGYNGTEYDTSDAGVIGMIQLGNGNVINTEGAHIYAEYLGMGLYGNGNVINDGTIYTAGVGMLFVGDISFDDELFFDIDNVVPLLAQGDLFGPINFGTGTVTNTGSIEAELAGIAAIGNVTINNSGEIDAIAGIAGVGPNVTINNSGLVDAGIVGILGAGDNVEINNDGVVIGALGNDLGFGIIAAGDSTINNSGVVIGNTVGIGVYGDSTINVDDGYVYGGAAGIVGLGGDQTVNVDGTVVGDTLAPMLVTVIPSLTDVERVAIALEEGNDRVNLRDDAYVVGDIRMGDGDDTVQIASGAHVEGLIHGGDTGEDRGDLLIVGDESMCGEDPDTNERVDHVRNLVNGINLDGDTFNFDGEDYTIEDFERGSSGVRSHRCYQFIEDGRINAYDMGATVAGYCNVAEGLNVWAIDDDGKGQVEFSVSAEQMRTALEQAVNGGSNVSIAAGERGSSLWALSSNQYQMMRNDGYVYIFEPGRCGPGGEIVLP